MTAPEMTLAFRFKADKLDTGSLADLRDEEILALLNEAQDRWAENRYSGMVSGRGYEKDQQRRDDLRTLTLEFSWVLVPANTLEDREKYRVPLQGAGAPPRYAHTLAMTARVDDGLCGAKDLSVDIVQIDDLSAALSNPFKKPSYSRGNTVGYFTSQGVTILTGGAALVGASLTYLKNPERIALTPQQDCELPEWVHRQVVEEAVSIALETLESQRTGTHQTFQIAKQE